MIGLKENVILGKLIPAGTGMKKYRNIAIEKDEPVVEVEEVEEIEEIEEIDVAEDDMMV